jgi:hypothetical protein
LHFIALEAACQINDWKFVGLRGASAGCPPEAADGFDLSVENRRHKAGVKVSETTSDLKRTGSAGAAKTRTCWELCLTVSIPFSRWGAKPFVVHPLRFPTSILEDLSPAAEERPQTQEPRIHPFLSAQSWRQQMKHDAKLNKARIAAREGISRARVTQVMDLLQLPTEIQASLLKPPAPVEIHSISERSLRVLVSYGDAETQISCWRELVQELKGSAGN